MSGKLNACRDYRNRLCSHECSDTEKDIGLKAEKKCDMRLLEHSLGRKNKQTNPQKIKVLSAWKLKKEVTSSNSVVRTNIRILSPAKVSSEE